MQSSASHRFMPVPITSNTRRRRQTSFIHVSIVARTLAACALLAAEARKMRELLSTCMGVGLFTNHLTAVLITINSSLCPPLWPSYSHADTCIACPATLCRRALFRIHADTIAGHQPRATSPPLTTNLPAYKYASDSLVARAVTRHSIRLPHSTPLTSLRCRTSRRRRRHRPPERSFSSRTTQQL